MRVSVIVPTFNEAVSIGCVLADIPRGEVMEILVVDGGSEDGTPEIAARGGARIIREPRRGYGRACLTGLAHAAAPDVVVFLDGDYSDRPAEMPLLLAPLRAGQADLVIGSRLTGQRMPGAMPWHAVVGNRLIAWLLGIVCGVHLTDLGPFRAARLDLLRALDLRETTYGWPVEMIAKAVRRGARVVEVPVSYHPRLGRSKISGTVRGSIGAAWGLFGGVLRYGLRPPSATR
jgi:glycosyltransferase involved in cell wall biosynthesis